MVETYNRISAQPAAFRVRTKSEKVGYIEQGGGYIARVYSSSTHLEEPASQPRCKWAVAWFRAGYCAVESRCPCLDSTLFNSFLSL